MALGIAGGRVALATDSPAIWIDVPYVEQTKEGCGSAVISMVMQYWAKQTGQALSPDMDAAKIQQLLYSREQKGIQASAMEDYFRKQNYQTHAFRGDWHDLETDLAKGRPLIVSLKASGHRGPLHYAVVVGIDRARGYVFLNDPAMGKMLRISREGFKSEWNLANNWTLLAVPSGTR
jgi:ABC-type bacteriocin/lantibiotic exporter with double-glycine peptidase domain